MCRVNWKHFLSKKCSITPTPPHLSPRASVMKKLTLTQIHALPDKKYYTVFSQNKDKASNFSLYFLQVSPLKLSLQLSLNA